MQALSESKPLSIADGMPAVGFGRYPSQTSLTLSLNFDTIQTALFNKLSFGIYSGSEWVKRRKISQILSGLDSFVGLKYDILCKEA